MPGCYAVFHKQLGDLVLLEPALSKLRDHHGAPVRCLTRSGHAAVLDLMPGISFQHGVPLTYRPHLYCFDPLNKSALRSLLAPARIKKCILPERREMQWFHSRLFGELIVPELGDRYVAEYFWDSTPVPSSLGFRPPQLEHPPDSWKPKDVGNERFVLLNPTSGWRQKSWLSDCWARTLGVLHNESGLSFVMTSGSVDWQVQHCRAIQERSRSFVRSLASETTLQNFLWLCSRALAVLTVDGAASHLARAFGVKSVTLFGPTNRWNWHYGGEGSIAVQAPPSKDQVCRLRDLSPDTVIDVCRHVLRSEL
ncbi:MAG TPA: glycosyltransferase family 9 protein [Terrimicrobiaceae bacterium]